MFGMNEKVGRNYFKDLAMSQIGRLIVTSRFYTLQGEGPFRGFPAYFIRLTKCNLDCSFCDTYFDKGDTLTFDHIFNQIEIDIKAFYKDRDMEVPEWAQGTNRRIVLVITGGEPSLQLNLIAFLEQANKIFYRTQIESNGILHINLEEQTIYVVSPKCMEKDGIAKKYFKPNKETLKRANCLKFVMSAPENETFSPYSEVPGWAHGWATETGKEIYISPMNIYKQEPQKAKEMRSSNQKITIEERSTVDEVISFWDDGLLDMKTNQRNHEYAADYCLKHGFIFQVQIHLLASLA